MKYPILVMISGKNRSQTERIDRFKARAVIPKKMSKAIALLTLNQKSENRSNPFYFKSQEIATFPSSSSSLAKHTAHRTIFMNSPNRFTQQIGNRKHR